MSNKFSSLLKKQNKNFDQLTKKLKEKTSGKSYKDERFWAVTRDEKDNGYAVIRFLPSPSPENLGVVSLYSHWFKGPTGLIYNERSLTTLDQPDPVGEYNSVLWNTGGETGKTQARKQKRHQNYYSNIVVLDDPADANNNGKVFLFKYGKKIMEKLTDLMCPSFPDEEPIDPFNIETGCDFKIKVRKVDGWINYDKSEFSSPSVLFEGNNERINTVFDSMYDIEEFSNPENFKSYNELKTKFNKVMCLTDGVTPTPVVDTDDISPSFANNKEKAEASKEVETDTAWSEDDEDLSYFDKFADS